MNFVALIFIIACLFVPTITIYTWVKIQERADRRTPLTDTLLRMPGDALSTKLRDTAFDLSALIFFSTIVPSIAIITLLSAWIDPEKVRFDALAMIMSIFILSGIGWSIWKTIKVMNDMRAARAGLEGELATAQLLSPLLTEGWKLFHDLPGQRGNIDHVLVGPQGIFAIETKYRSKRRSQKGKDSALVEYDGTRLRFANGAYETLPLEQARATSTELSKMLMGKLGHSIPVTPVVALPGWFVKYTARLDSKFVGVINPKSHGWLKQRAQTLDEPLQVRICAALSDLARRS
ncbi:nuclease-related domain-containing protein [Pseudomonas putida]